MLYSLTLFAYLSSFLFILLYFFHNSRKLYISSQISIFISVMLNFLTIILRWVSLKQFPASTLFDILSMTMFFLGTGYIILFVKFKRPFLSLLILPFIIAAGVGGFLSENIVYQKQHLSTFWIYIHLPLTIGGTAFFLISALCGILYFMQERQLKNKNFGLIFKNFPPLETINNLNNFSIFTGFVLFSGGIISGIIWGLIEWNGTLILSSKLIFSFITWIIFFIIIIIKKIRGLTPKQAASLSIIGIILILLTYHGVANFLLR